MRTQAVGRCVRYRCEARPSKASRPCSSSYVPSGRPTWACLVTRPFDSGNMTGLLSSSGTDSTRASHGVPARLFRRALSAALLRLLRLAGLLLALPVLGPPDRLAIASAH